MLHKIWTLRRRRVSGIVFLWCVSVLNLSFLVVFAPIALIMKYQTIDEAIAIANGTRFGLGASVFGPDQEQCLKVAKALNCGMVSINDFAVYYVSVYPRVLFDLHITHVTDVRLAQVSLSRVEYEALLLKFSCSQDLPFGGVKMSGYGRFGTFEYAFLPGFLK